jgi:hypothetical protein
MQYSGKIAACALALAAAVASGSTEAAFERDSYKTKGGEAYGEVSGGDDCGYGWITVYGYETLAGQDDENIGDNVATVFINVYNWCTGRGVTGYIERVPDIFTPPQNKLVSAQVAEVSVPVTECSNECRETVATVAVTWVGTGSISNTHYVQHQKVGVPGQKFASAYRSQTQGSFRSADVVLRAEIDGQPIEVPGDFTYGYMSYNKSGSVTMTRTTP